MSKLRAGLPTILLYHQIGNPAEDPFRQFVRPDHFAEQMAVVARRRPVSLIELARGLREGPAPADSVAVTFDDGYLSNLRLAKPALEAAGVPATVFVTTGMTGGERDFWWNELADAVRQAPEPAGELRLAAARGERAWATDGVDRARLLFELWAWMRTQSEAILQAALEAVRRWSGAPAPAPPGDRLRCMTIDELHELRRGGTVAIGAHTRTHPVLAARSRREQLEEIAGSRSDLEEWLGEPVAAFAYPFGRRVVDYRAAAVRAVRQSGFDVGAAVAARPVSSRSGVFELPRHAAPDIPADEFERWLAERMDAPPARLPLMETALTRTLRERRPARDRL